MKHFKKILVYVDAESKEHIALKRATELAKNCGAPLRVISVLKEFPRVMRMSFTVVHLAELQEIVAQEMGKYLKALVEPIRADGVEVTTQVLWGSPPIEIIREVLRNKHDLVMKTAREKGSLRKTLFGSTAMNLMRKCPCPVWVVKSTHTKRYARILAAVDPAPDDPERDALNTKIMELATFLSESEGSELHVINAFRIMAEGPLLRMGIDIAKLRREVRAAAKKNLEKFLSNYNVTKPKQRVHLLCGDPGYLIPDLARKKRIELIVMGTVARSGISGLLSGNTAAEVLPQIDCSVLAVKPDGFVSPVTLEQK